MRQRTEWPAGTAQGRVRVTLEFSRSDDPALFDALVSLPKGRRRVARVRTLAHDGLLAERAGTRPVLALAKTEGSDLAGDFGLDVEHDLLTWLDPRLTVGVFDAPLDE